MTMTTPKSEIEAKLLGLLGRGKEAAITSRGLRALLTVRGYSGISDAELRRIAKDLLLAGHPVVSCSRGFFLADNLAELLAYRDNLEMRIRALARDIRAVDSLLADCETRDLFAAEAAS